MGFLGEAGAIEIGKMTSGAHNYVFSQVYNRLYAVFAGVKGTGEIWESRNQGLNWIQVDDIGRVDAIAVRYGTVCYRRDNGSQSPVLGFYDLRTGNGNQSVPVDGQGNAIKWSGLPIPFPEASEQSVWLHRQETFGGQYYYYDNSTGLITARVPGDRTFAFWGPGPVGGSVSFNCIWEYVDRFWEANRFACWGRFLFGGGLGGTSTWQIKTVRGSSGPFVHTFENDIHGSGYEGFMNGGFGFEGVGKQEGNPSPSFFMPADHWQGNQNNSSPMWIPDLTSDFVNLKFPVASTPSGLTGDSGFSRGAVMGFVQGRKTFGLIEPGFGFAHCATYGYAAVNDLTGSGGFDGGSGGSAEVAQLTKFNASFGQRKFIGNLDVSFSRGAMWMPASLGIFGMGVTARLTGSASNVQTVFWVYDKKPDRIPTSVLVENGTYTDRDDVKASQAFRGDGAYYRW